jgi:biotin carboxyl carrier protein
MKYYATVNGVEYTIEIDRENQILVNGVRHQIDFQQLPEAGTLSLLLDNRSLEAIVEARDDAWEVLLHGELYSVRVQDERAYRLSQARGVLVEDTAELAIRSPMPGLILDVLVAPGDHVARGEKVVILESMKMENELRSSRDGLVKRVNVSKGANVEKDQTLVVIGDADELDEPSR